MQTETEEQEIEVELPKPKRSKLRVLITLSLAIIGWVVVTSLIALWYIMELAESPNDFPIDTPIVIEQGSDVRMIARQLADSNVVHSADLLYFVLVFAHDPANIKASTYVFDKPIDVFAVATRLTEGDFDTDLVRFTHIEGERAELLAKRAAEVLPQFNEEAFIATALPLEGRLFPDTYFVPETYTDGDMIELLTETYIEKTEPLAEQIALSNFTEDEILILASIVEREANTPESKRYVAGIFQNRLAIGMALQADASIEYVIETPLNELPAGQLASELREIDSPYNTYLYPGLPPTPIGNPGLEAITAVLQPIESEYMYYITGSDGKFYYAETYEQHLANIERHLR